MHSDSRDGDDFDPSDVAANGPGANIIIACRAVRSVASEWHSPHASSAFHALRSAGSVIRRRTKERAKTPTRREDTILKAQRTSLAMAAAVAMLGLGASQGLAADPYTIYLSNNFVGNDWRQQMIRVAEAGGRRSRRWPAAST